MVLELLVYDTEVCEKVQSYYKFVQFYVLLLYNSVQCCANLCNSSIHLRAILYNFVQFYEVPKCILLYY